MDSKEQAKMLLQQYLRSNGTSDSSDPAELDTLVDALVKTAENELQKRAQKDKPAQYDWRGDQLDFVQELLEDAEDTTVPSQQVSLALMAIAKMMFLQMRWEVQHG